MPPLVYKDCLYLTDDIRGIKMLNKTILLSILLALSGCTKNHENTEVQLVKLNKTPLYYDITFLSKTDFSTPKSASDTGSYIHCIDDKEIYNNNYIPDYSSGHYLAGIIPKDTKPRIEKTSNKYIYRINLQRSKDIYDSKTLYCRVFTGSFIRKLKKSAVFELNQ